MNLAALPKVRFKADGDTVRKAMAMVRRGKTDQFISDYLGMETVQVEEIRRRTPGERGRPPAVQPTRRREAIAYAQRRAPLSIREAVTAEAAAAEQGSAEFRKALLAYGAKHGMPNLTRLQCKSELRTLCMIREEELAIADRIEAELSRPPFLSECDW